MHQDPESCERLSMNEPLPPFASSEPSVIDLIKYEKLGPRPTKLLDASGSTLGGSESSILPAFGRLVGFRPGKRLFHLHVFIHLGVFCHCHATNSAARTVSSPPNGSRGAALLESTRATRRWLAMRPPTSWSSPRPRAAATRYDAEGWRGGGFWTLMN